MFIFLHFLPGMFNIIFSDLPPGAPDPWCHDLAPEKQKA
jgi:hypothetical protein